MIWALKNEITLRGRAWRGPARPGMARLGGARQGKARIFCNDLGFEKRNNAVGPGRARPGQAWHGLARQGKDFLE